MTGLEPPDGPLGTPSLPARLSGRIKDIYREEGEAWRRHYRKYFKTAARALGAGFAIGFAFFLLRPDREAKALEIVVRALKDIPLEASPAVLALSLFYHNARASAIAVTSGWVPFLFLPILDPLLNGAVLGLLASISKHQGLNVPLLFLTQILPHGVFELAAVLYATSLGLYLSAETGKRAVAARRRRKERRKGVVSASPGLEDFLEAYPDRAAASESLLWNVVRSFVFVVLPLLAVAAFIEGFITPNLG